MLTNPTKERSLTQFVASLTKIGAFLMKKFGPTPAMRYRFPAFRFCSSGSVTYLNALLPDINAGVTEFNGLFNARNSKINAL